MGQTIRSVVWTQRLVYNVAGLLGWAKSAEASTQELTPNQTLKGGNNDQGHGVLS